MANIILQLKKRKEDNRIVMPLDFIKTIMRNPDIETAKQKLWNFFAPVIDSEVYTHDKLWLKKLCDWQPPKGLALSKIARWFPLIGKVNDIDDTEDCEFEITQFQADLLWDRLKNDQFVPFPNRQGQSQEISITFIRFITHFQEVGGYHFEKEEPKNLDTNPDDHNLEPSQVS